MTKKHLPTIIATTLITITITILTLLTLMNRPIADSFGYIDRFQDHPVQAFLTETNSGWSGRHLQTLVISTGVGLFGTRAAQIMPIILLVIFAAALIYLIHTLLAKNKLLATLTGAILALTTLFTLPALFDDFLWYDAAAVYLVGGAVICFNSALLIKLFRTDKPTTKLQLYLILLSLFIGQFALETTSALLIVEAGLLFIFKIAKKRSREAKLLALALLPLILGLILMFLGSSGRQQVVSTQIINPIELLKSSTFGLFSFWGTLSFEKISLILSTGIFISLLLSVSKIKAALKPKTKILLGLTIIIIPAFISNMIIVFSNVYQNYIGPNRNLLIPTLGLIIGVTLITIGLIESRKALKTTHLAIAAALLFVLAAPWLLKLNLDLVRKVAHRSIEFDIRAQDLNEQLAKNPSEIRTNSLPIFLEKSDALDIQPIIRANGESKPIDWIVDDFRRFYNIPETTILYIDGIKYQGSTQP